MEPRWQRCTDPSESTYEITEEGHGARIVFSPCGVTSRLPGDVENRFCAYCGEFIQTETVP